MPRLPELPEVTDEQRYGTLISSDIKLYRKYFEEAVRLHGIQCIYYAPKEDKEYTLHGEIVSDYEDPVFVGCLFDDHPTQRTMKKLGWVAELQKESSAISVPYDLPGIQVGALFAVPSGIDNSEYRFFRVASMSNIMVYPDSITCELVPEYADDLPDDKLDVSKGHNRLLAQDDPDVF